MSKILTDIDVANLALGYLGEQRILSFTESSREARAMTLHYNQTLREILEMHRWSRGRKRARLTRIQEAPAFGYLHSFQLPADCVRVLDVVALPESGFTKSPPPVRAFDIEDRLLLSDTPHCGLVYGREVITSDLSPLLIKSLALTLASKVAPALGEARLGGALYDQAMNATQDAWMSDVRQSRSGENSDIERRSDENQARNERNFYD